MPSLGYLLLFFLVVTLLSPASGYYMQRPKCPSVVSRTNCPSVRVRPCRINTDCLSSQSCCDSGCGSICYSIRGFFDFFTDLFSCDGCGECFGGGCEGRCSRCAQNGGGYGNIFGKK